MRRTERSASVALSRVDRRKLHIAVGNRRSINSLLEPSNPFY